jgi:hypothetical protein
MEEPTTGDARIPEEEPSICRAKPSFYALRYGGDLTEERLRVLEIGGVTACGEPVVDRGQYLVGGGVLALVLPQPTEAQRRPEFQRPGLLLARHGEGMGPIPCVSGVVAKRIPHRQPLASRWCARQGAP